MKRRVSEIARFTRDPKALAEFYADILDRQVPPTEGRMYNFEVQGVNLFIHVAGDAQPELWPDDVDHIAFEVEDLDAECRRLTAAGYELKGPDQFPWGRAAYLYDPDGRLVELHGSDVVYG